MKPTTILILLLVCAPLTMLTATMDSKDAVYENQSVSSSSFNFCPSISISAYGTGPYGQVDVQVFRGSAPYKFYKNGSLLFTSSDFFVTLPFGCDGGTLYATASTSCGTATSQTIIIPPGCAEL